MVDICQSSEVDEQRGQEHPRPPSSTRRAEADCGDSEGTVGGGGAGRAATEAQLEAAKALPAAYLREVFEGEDATTWPSKHIGEFAKVQSGYAFKSDWFVNAGIRLLRNANVFQNRIEWDDVVCLPEAERERDGAFELAVNDIVLTLDRPIVSNGLKVARLSEQDVPSLLLQRVGRFKLFGNIHRVICTHF